MVDFSKKNTKESGGRFGDKNCTFGGCTWEESTASSGFTGIYFVAKEFETEAGETHEKRWLLGDAEKLRNRLRVNDDGTLEDVDEDNPYVPRVNDETSQLFNSLEEAGVSMKILQNIGSNPGGLDGITAHMVEKPTGRKQKKNGVETQYDQTWLVAESLVDAPKAGAKGKAAAKPAAAASKKSTKVVEPEEDEADESDVDPIDAACIATIQAVLATPKKFVPTYNAKQNGGGLTIAQMRSAALGNAVPKEHKAVSKADVSKRLGKPAIYEQYADELWAFDSDEGVVSAIDE